LVTHGILQSTRGVDGGYSLLRRPEDISVLDVIEAIEGPVGSSLPAPGGLNEESQARLRTALHEVTSTARRQLQAIKLSQIIQPAESKVS
jgi:DNA-binding IscR family transcriptional regulator